MSDRIKGLIVTLDSDFKDEDAEAIIKAILMVKGVLTVTPSVVNPSDVMNRLRVISELREKIFNLFEE